MYVQSAFNSLSPIKSSSVQQDVGACLCAPRRRTCRFELRQLRLLICHKNTTFNFSSNQFSATNQKHPSLLILRTGQIGCWWSLGVLSGTHIGYNVVTDPSLWHCSIIPVFWVFWHPRDTENNCSCFSAAVCASLEICSSVAVSMNAEPKVKSQSSACQGLAPSVLH